MLRKTRIWVLALVPLLGLIFAPSLADAQSWRYGPRWHRNSYGHRYYGGYGYGNRGWYTYPRHRYYSNYRYYPSGYYGRGYYDSGPRIGVRTPLGGVYVR